MVDTWGFYPLLVIVEDLVREPLLVIVEDPVREPLLVIVEDLVREPLLVIVEDPVLSASKNVDSTKSRLDFGEMFNLLFPNDGYFLFVKELPNGFVV